jgi:hypothetical protein
MKKQLLTLIGALSLLTVLGHFFEKQLLAQVRAALVQNVDEPGRNPITLLGSSTGGTATVTVPAGQRYVIQAFGGTCVVDAGDEMTAIDIGGGVKGAQATASAFQLHPGVWGASTTTHLYIDPGSSISWAASTLNGTTPEACTFRASGYAITLP